MTGTFSYSYYCLELLKLGTEEISRIKTNLKNLDEMRTKESVSNHHKPQRPRNRHQMKQKIPPFSLTWHLATHEFPAKKRFGMSVCNYSQNIFFWVDVLLHLAIRGAIRKRLFHRKKEKEEERWMILYFFIYKNIAQLFWLWLADFIIPSCSCIVISVIMCFLHFAVFISYANHRYICVILCLFKRVFVGRSNGTAHMHFQIQNTLLCTYVHCM